MNFYQINYFYNTVMELTIIIENLNNKNKFKMTWLPWPKKPSMFKYKLENNKSKEDFKNLLISYGYQPRGT